MITSAPLSSHLHTVFPLCIHIFFSLCLHLFPYHPPSAPDRRYFWTSSVGWIWGRIAVAVGCNPEVHRELSQSPPRASHVPDLWHRAFEGHFRFLGEEAGLLGSGPTTEPAGQQQKCLRGSSAVWSAFRCSSNNVTVVSGLQVNTGVISVIN